MRHVRLPGYSASDLDRLSYSNGDIVSDTTNTTIRYMDGVTPGGFKLATQSYVQNNTITAGNLASNLAVALTPYAKTADLAPYALTVDVNSAISAIPIYSLPTASTTVKGGVKVDGTSITIDGNGVIRGSNQYTLPIATTSVIGGVRPDGTSITINPVTGVISGSNQYVLPKATTSVLGGVKVDGTTILVDANGVISGANQYVLPTATTTVKGGVIIPAVATSGITNSSGTIGLATATTSQLGGVIIPATVSSGLTNTSGSIRLATATTTQLGGVKVDGVTITINGSGVIAANITGAIVFQGGWSAATNTPTLNNTSSAYNTNGFEFVTTAAGTVNFGAGNVSFAVGDNVIYDGTKWVKIPIGSSAGTTNSILTFDNTGTGAATGTAFNGSAPFTISYNTVGASPLAGSSSLTTLGTVATGIWNGSVISSTYGGTGVNNSGRTLTISGANRVLDQDVASASSPNFIGTNFSGTAASLTAGSATTATSATKATNLAGGVANQLHYQTGADTSAFVTAASGTSTFLQWTGSAFTWTTVALATAATNLAGGAANRIHVQTAADTSGFIVAPTVTGTYLQWNGTSFVFSTVSGASGGTVTQIIASSSAVSGLSLSGGTITGSGTIAITGTLSLATAPAIGSVGANTGAFTTLSASTSVSFSPSGTITLNPTTAGTINNMSIGATTASTGAFTTLSASTSVSFSPSGVITLNPTTAGTINNMSIGATTASTGRFTTITSTQATGTAPFTVASTTNVANLNASSLNGATFASPGAIGGTTASTGAFTTLTASTQAGTTTGSGTLVLSNATAGRIDFASGPFAAPTFNGVSTGAKIILWPANATTSADYAIGIEGSTLWFGTPTTGEQFKWYGGTTNVMGLSAAGALTVKGSIGYTTGVGTGGAVTQLVSRTTGVTLSKITGQITLFAAAGTTGAYTQFVVTNTTVAATDNIILQCSSSTNTYFTIVTAIAAGSFTVNFISINGTAVDSPVFNFTVIKGSAS